MGAREELTSILRDASEAAIAGGLPVLTYEGYAEAAVMAGWRPPPRAITDPAFCDPCGDPRQTGPHQWSVALRDGQRAADLSWLIWMPVWRSLMTCKPIPRPTAKF